MEKDTTVCFQTTLRINHALEKIAENEKLSVSEVVNNIINRYLKDNKKFQETRQNHRRFERKTVDLPAYIGDPRWHRQDFKAVTILDISIGGIKFALPKGTKLGVRRDGDKHKFIIIFRLPNHRWPINVQIAPLRIFESNEDVQVGAALVNPDFNAYSVLQQYMI